MNNQIPYYSVPALTSYDEQMHYGSTITINDIWRISYLFSAGAEYRYVVKTTEGGEHISNNRVYLMLMMNF